MFHVHMHLFKGQGISRPPAALVQVDGDRAQEEDAVQEGREERRALSGKFKQAKRAQLRATRAIWIAEATLPRSAPPSKQGKIIAFKMNLKVNQIPIRITISILMLITDTWPTRHPYQCHFITRRFSTRRFTTPTSARRQISRVIQQRQRPRVGQRRRRRFLAIFTATKSCPPPRRPRRRVPLLPRPTTSSAL